MYFPSNLLPPDLGTCSGTGQKGIHLICLLTITAQVCISVHPYLYANLELWDAFVYL
jgi:hypothetical protein